MAPILKGSARRGMALLTSSALGGQVLILILTPILTRLYSPEAYGALAVLLSVVSIASTVASLRLETAIPIATLNEVRTMLRITTAASITVAVVSLPVAVHVLPAAVTTAGKSMSIWLAYTILVTATVVFASFSGVAYRERHYGLVASRNFLQQIGTAGSQLAFASVSPTLLGLVSGVVVGRSLGIMAMLRKAYRDVLRGTEAAPLRRTLRQYWRYPCIFMPSALLNVAGSELPLLLVAYKYGTDAAGNLSQTIRFGSVPASLIGAAASSVIMSEIASRVRQGQLNNRGRYLQATQALLLLAVIWGGLMALVAPRLLPMILGPGWAEAGEFSRSLSLSIATGLVASPLSVVFVVYQRALANILIDLTRFSLVGLLGLSGWAAGLPANTVIFMMALGLTSIYLVTWGVGLRIVSPAADSADIEPREIGIPDSN